MTVGVIADTHGLLRQEAVRTLAGCARIIHAGDIGKEEILDELGRIAPVTAIRGNVDLEPWAQDRLPAEIRVKIAGVTFFVLHDRNALRFDPADAGIGVVISGHSHRPLIERVGGVLYVNPGSAGRRRFSLPVALARLAIRSGGIDVTLVDLLAESTAQTMGFWPQA